MAMAMAMTMLLRRGDLNLNCSAQAYEDSIKEGVRQAMLRHEAVFRSQVRELHRLYWTQKNLMHELFWKGSDVYTGISSRSAADDEFGMESNHFMVDATNVKKIDVLREQLGDSYEIGRQTNRGFDLSADVFITDSGDEIDEVLEVKASPFDKSNVGLVRGETDHHVGFSLSACNVIDLEKPVTLECEEAVIIPVDDHQNADVDKLWREPKGHLFSVGSPSANLNTRKQKTTRCKLPQIDLNVAQDDESIQDLPDPVVLFHSPPTSSSVVHHGIFWRDSSIIYPNEYESKNGYSKDSSVTDLSGHAISAQGISKLRIADSLFHVQEDSHILSSQASASNAEATESAWNHNQPMVDIKSHGSGPDGPQECYRHSLDGSSSVSNGGGHSSLEFHKSFQENVCSLPGELHSAVHRENQRQPSIVVSSNNVNAEYNSMHGSVGSTSLPMKLTSELEEKQAHHDGSEEDAVSSHAITECERLVRQQDEFSGEYPVGSKPDRLSGITECTSSVDPSVVENVPLPNSNDSGLNQLHEVDVPEASDHVNLPSKLSIIDDIDQLQAHSTEMDHTVAQAAETLLCISSEKSTCFTDDLARKSRPEYSSDSFERSTLNLQETTDDGLSIPATPAEDTRKDTCGIKLRRGRGLRDFQKEILPGLVSLARNEICDDMHTIGYALRKNRSRRNCGDTPSTPVRTRRSRLYSTGRRN